MLNIDAKIEAIKAEAKKKIAQLKAQEEMIEARKVQALIKGNRSNETRKKILAGALVLEMMEGDDATKKRFIDRLDKYLTRADDRALFGLQSESKKSDEVADNRSAGE